MGGDDPADVSCVAVDPCIVCHTVLDTGDQREGEPDHFYVMLLDWFSHLGVGEGSGFPGGGCLLVDLEGGGLVTVAIGTLLGLLGAL